MWKCDIVTNPLRIKLFLRYGQTFVLVEEVVILIVIIFVTRENILNKEESLKIELKSIAHDIKNLSLIVSLLSDQSKKDFVKLAELSENPEYFLSNENLPSDLDKISARISYLAKRVYLAARDKLDTEIGILKSPSVLIPIFERVQEAKELKGDNILLIYENQYYKVSQMDVSVKLLSPLNTKEFELEMMLLLNYLYL